MALRVSGTCQDIPSKEKERLMHLYLPAWRKASLGSGYDIFYTLTHFFNLFTTVQGVLFWRTDRRKGTSQINRWVGSVHRSKLKTYCCYNSTAPSRGALTVSNVEKSSQYWIIIWSQLFLHFCGGSKKLEVRINKNLHKSDLLDELGTRRRKIDHEKGGVGERHVHLSMAVEMKFEYLFIS